MSRLSLILVLVVAGIIGLGFYCNWFRVVSDNNSITVTVDKQKVREDEEKVQDKIRNLTQRGTEKVTTTTKVTKDVAAPTP